MNRTWKEAACEVAWNRIQKYRSQFNFTAFCPIGVLRERAAFVTYSNMGFTIPHDFTAFRDAFMKWLDENEVKK